MKYRCGHKPDRPMTRRPRSRGPGRIAWKDRSPLAGTNALISTVVSSLICVQSGDTNFARRCGGGMAVRNLCRERFSDRLGGDWDMCYVGVLAAIVDGRDELCDTSFFNAGATF